MHPTERLNIRQNVFSKVTGGNSYLVTSLMITTKNYAKGLTTQGKLTLIDMVSKAIVSANKMFSNSSGSHNTNQTPG